LGVGPAAAVLTLYLLGAISGGAAVLVTYLSTEGALITAALVIVFFGVAFLYRNR
jgi:hypothetical protein